MESIACDFWRHFVMYFSVRFGKSLVWVKFFVGVVECTGLHEGSNQMSDNKNEFKDAFEVLGVEESLLPVLMNANRSTVHKYLRGQVAVPASALAFVRLLGFMKTRDMELFREWMVLCEMSTKPEHYLPHPELWKIYKDSFEKMRPSVRHFLDETRGRTVK